MLSGHRLPPAKVAFNGLIDRDLHVQARAQFFSEPKIKYCSKFLSSDLEHTDDGIISPSQHQSKGKKEKKREFHV